MHPFEVKEFNTKVEDLLLRFLFVYRVEEQNYHNKRRHIPVEQVIYDYHWFIQSILQKMVELLGQ